MRVSRQFGERGFVLRDMTHERRTLRRDRDRIHEREIRIGDAVEEVRAQHGCAAVVVCEYAGA